MFAMALSNWDEKNSRYIKDLAGFVAAETKYTPSQWSGGT